MEETTPFRIDVQQNILDDLQLRLLNTRWPDEIKDEDWNYGADQVYMKELVRYWKEQYDWRAQEEKLNQFSHYRTVIDGYGLHFIQQRGKGENRIPLLLIHGWPDSFHRMYKIIPLLTDANAHGREEAQSFDVIIPSIPGFGFSDKLTDRKFHPKTVADLFATLMRDVLGYEKFAVHGGDWGSSIAEQMAFHHADSLIGIHLTDIPFWRLFSIKPDELTKPEQDYMKRGQEWSTKGGTYGLMQATRPQTLSYGLNDSPIGLAAWIVDPFRSWSDCNGDIENCFSKDELLTNIMIYWVTQTISSSMRIYYETGKMIPWPQKGRVETPTGVAIFPKDLVTAPREFGDRFYNIQSWHEMPRGGHFAALEQPELLADDISQFFSALTAKKKGKATAPAGK
jgi:pimeloyl-ACP methyl ester carboxylesterase